ncbi:MAG: NAD(P) transhydrogenase subunit beta, partial [Gammaproteobacteria bacterium]
MSEGLVTATYIGATILFILTLGGLSDQETARKGNVYGMIGMTIAILATVLGPEVSSNFHIIIITMLIGGSIGMVLARKVQMTQMP